MNNSDITVVFQGSMYDDGYRSTEAVIDEFMSRYPGIQIIVSTWKDSCVSERVTEKCTVIKSEDPGVVRNWPGNKPNNINRQIRSTYIGLRQVRTRYAMKIRTDCSVSVEKVFSLYYQNCTDDNKILITNVTTKNPRLNRELIFHFSDWLYFGPTEIMKDMFDIPSYQVGAITNVPLSPEQYITLCWVYRSEILENKSIFYKDVPIECQEELLRKEFVLVSYNEIDILPLKIGYRRLPFGKNGFLSYSHYEVQRIRNGLDLDRQAPIELFRKLLFRIQYTFITVGIMCRDLVRKCIK